MIFVDADGIFARIFKKSFRGTVPIPVHVFAGGNHKPVRNKRFHCYLNKVPQINSEYKGSLHQWLQGVIFEFYACNARPVDGTGIVQSVVDNGREFLFTIYLSPSRAREDTSEEQKCLERFEAVSLIIFRQRELLNILVSERILIHRELRKKVNLMRYFGTGAIVVVSNQVKSSINYGVAHNIIFKQRDPEE